MFLQNLFIPVYIGKCLFSRIKYLNFIRLIKTNNNILWQLLLFVNILKCNLIEEWYIHLNLKDWKYLPILSSLWFWSHVSPSAKKKYCKMFYVCGRGIYFCYIDDWMWIRSSPHKILLNNIMYTTNVDSNCREYKLTDSKLKTLWIGWI